MLKVDPQRGLAPWDLAAQWLSENTAIHRDHESGDVAAAIDAALDSGAVDGDAVTRWWTDQSGLRRWDGTLDLQGAVKLAERINFDFAMDHLLLLISADAADGSAPPASYRCLTARPWRWQAIDNLSLHVGGPLELFVAPEVIVRDLIGRVYDRRMAESESVAAAAAQSTSQAPSGGVNVEVAIQQLGDRDLLSSADKEPVTRLVDALLFDASQKRASDIHVQPYPEQLKVRYRLDGVLHDSYHLPQKLQDQVVGRIKVLAGMDVSEKRLAQDGRTSVQIGSRQIDLRVSTLPTTCGERVVIRLLEQTANLRELSELGMPADVEQRFREAVGRSTGLILVTGPTGSGKTTTLYSALAQLDARAKNILTLEDPVEYRLAGISQAQVSDKKGMTFLSGLRHILRQDPDVVMVGEIRDEPTARMVIQSSLTGHLVLSTLHTNSAAGAVARLMDLGIEPFMIASSVIGVLAQRLVRTSCSQCTASGGTDARCSWCNGTGYRGRVALFEWLGVTPDVRRAILAGSSAERLEEAATRAGMLTLRQRGVRAVAQRLTDEAEVARVLGTDDAAA